MPLAGASQAKCVVLAQSPQFCTSLVTSTHAEPHSLKPCSHSRPHLPPVQVALPCWGTGQAMPHALQLSGLVSTSMQDPLQFLRVPEQSDEHLPPSQTCAAEQAVSQSPQRPGSFDTSTQAPEQLSKPGLHSTLHSPSLQTATPPSASSQVWPQPPQFVKSLDASTQVVPQGKKPFWQAKEHEESTQTGLPCGGALHGVSHERQLFSSLLSTTHDLPQTVSPSRHTSGPTALPSATHLLLVVSQV